MERQRAAEVLEEVATLLELAGENPFRARAYRNAARVVREHKGPLAELAAGPGKVRGIGPSLARALGELAASGDLKYRQTLRRAVPAGLLEMVELPGVGPATARSIHEHTGATTLAELESLGRSGALGRVPGIGPRLEEKILAGVRHQQRQAGRFLYPLVLREARELCGALAARPGLRRLAWAGELRRAAPSAGRLELVASADSGARAVHEFCRLPGHEAGSARSRTQAAAVRPSGLAVALHVFWDEEFALALHALTGSAAHVEGLRRLAARQGYHLTQSLLTQNGEPVPLPAEEDLFRRLGLAFVPPELREGEGELEAAAAGKLPRLVEEADLRGLLHLHAPAAELETRARELLAGRFSWLGLVFRARGGRAPAEAAGWLAAARRLREEGLPVLLGIEAPAGRDGRLETEAGLLAAFDFVIATVHGQLNLRPAAMLKRALRAIREPRVALIGYPTGRLFLGRPEYREYVERVIEEAARRGVALELSAGTHEAEAISRFCRFAARQGARICLSPDTAGGAPDFAYGLATARRGWLDREQVVNARDFAGVRQVLRLAPG